MTSLRSHEGYVLLDHTDSEGVPAHMEARMGLKVGSTKEAKLELPSYTCSHCEKVVMLNPDRQRERSFCRKCNHRLCDKCGVVMSINFECMPFKARIQEEQERLFLAEQRGVPAAQGSLIIFP